MHGEPVFERHRLLEAVPAVRGELPVGDLQAGRRFLGQGRARLRRPVRAFGLEVGDDLLHRTGAEAAVDRRLVLGKRGGAGVMGAAGEQPVDGRVRVAAEVGGLQGLVQRLQRIARHHMGGEAESEGVGRTDARAGEAEVEPGPALEPRQEVGRAHVGEEADPGLGHGEECALGHDAVGAVDRDPDAAAHDDAVDQRDIGLRVAEDEGVEPVFLGVEDGGEAALGIVLLAVDEADVAAGAEGHAAVLPRGTAHDDGGDPRILRPFPQSRVEVQHHGLGQRVERLRPVQGDASRPALPFQDDLVAHAASAPGQSPPHPKD